MQTEKEYLFNREVRVHPYLDDIGMGDAIRILAMNHLRPRPIYDTWDIHLPDSNKRVEVKASKQTLQANKRGGYYYRFSFSHVQIDNDSFDYALCLGYDNDVNLHTWYLVPQKYLAMKKRHGKTRSKSAYTLTIKPIETLLRKSTTSKFQSVRENIKPLLISDKGAFTRKKYYIAKKLTES